MTDARSLRIDTAATGGVIIHVHAQPGARRTELVGLHGDSLKIRIAAPPVDGRANELLLAFLAREFGVLRSTVSIRSGSTARRKRVRLNTVTADDAARVLGRLLASP